MGVSDVTMFQSAMRNKKKYFIKSFAWKKKFYLVHLRSGGKAANIKPDEIQSFPANILIV